MRVEAVNSYLSSIPFVEYHPVPAIGREGGYEQVPQVKIVAGKIQIDTIGKAELPFDFISPRPTLSKLTASEMNALEALIAFERYRTDHLAHSFPGLIKA